MATTTTTTPSSTPSSPEPSRPAKFAVNARVVAISAKAKGTVTKATWQPYRGGLWVYEVRYDATGGLSTWLESQLKAGGA